MAGRSVRTQCLAALSASLSAVCMGVLLTWPSPAIPKLEFNKTSLIVNQYELSWIASVNQISAPLGSLIAKHICDGIGRKKSIMAAALPNMLCAILSIVATSANLLYVARLFGGFGIGLIHVSNGVYLAEIADKRIRGAIGVLQVFMYNVGCLLMYIVGPFVPYLGLNIMLLVVPVIAFFSILWVPESPYYLLKVGRVDDAKKSLRILNRMKDEKLLNSELTNMKELVDKEMEGKTSIYALLTRREYRKTVSLIFILKMAQNMTGALAIQAYVGYLFEHGVKNFPPQYGSILFGLCQASGSLAAMFMADKVGRRPLLLNSSFATMVTLIVLGLYYYLTKLYPYYETIVAIPIITIMAFNIAYQCGIGTISGMYLNEIFPTNVRSAATATNSVLGAAMAFITTKGFQNVIDMLGFHSVFWCFALVTFVAWILLYFFVFETKGKSFKEIQAYIRNEGVQETEMTLLGVKEQATSPFVTKM